MPFLAAVTNSDRNDSASLLVAKVWCCSSPATAQRPVEACKREVWEELGLHKQTGTLLVADWAPSDAEGDKVLFVFHGGRLNRAEVERIQFQAEEIAEIRFYKPSEFPSVLPDRLVRRLSAAVEAHRRGASIYLEHGGPHGASGTAPAIAVPVLAATSRPDAGQLAAPRRLPRPHRQPTRLRATAARMSGSAEMSAFCLLCAELLLSSGRG